MTFDNSVKTCLRKSLSFEGRASRSEYWYFNLFIILIYIVEILLLFVFNGDTDETSSIFFILLYCLTAIVLLPAGISVTVRRFHDVNRSGWNFWWSAIPYVGSFIVLYFMVQPSSTGTNEYGTMPSDD